MRGPLAHSHFRMEGWLTQINHRVPQVTTLASEYIHFLELDEVLSDTEHNMLASLLNYGSGLSELKSDSFRGLKILVIPKPGSRSNWSIKAMDLISECHLNKVKKIERGIVYYLGTSEKLTWGDREAIASLLYEPERESVFYDLEEAGRLLKETKIIYNALNTTEDLNHRYGKVLTLYKRDFYGNSIHLSNYHLRHLNIPGFEQPWESGVDESQNKLNSLQTILELPIEIANFNHENGSLNWLGYLRTYHSKLQKTPLVLNELSLEEIIIRLFHFPVVADKSYLMTISDRFISGLVVNDGLIGPWQVAVSDCYVMFSNFDFNAYEGVALSVGERSPLGFLDPKTSIRMAIGEAITNIASAAITDLSDLKIQLQIKTNEDNIEKNNELKKIALETSQALNINLDFKLQLGDEFNAVVIAEAMVSDVRKTITPQLVKDDGSTVLIFIDLSDGHQRMAGSVLSEVFNQTGDFVPDLNNPILLIRFFKVIQQLKSTDKILAYHDRSNGGLLVTLCEMAFSGHVGLQLDVSELGRNIKSILFNEELGVVIQVPLQEMELVLEAFTEGGVPNCYFLGTLDDSDKISVVFNEEVVCLYDRAVLQKMWSETGYRIQFLRDNPRLAKKQYETIDDKEDPGINAILTFDPKINITAPYIHQGLKPVIAILGEQEIYHHQAMIIAFEQAAFDCVLIHMSDLQSGRLNLDRFNGLAVCGGFSFEDVLGSGNGWAKRILFDSRLRDQFEHFFNREDNFTLGVSNGCKMLSSLRRLIPGAEYWPNFVQNYSEQFESRWCMVEVQKTESPFFQGMVGSRLPVPVSHQAGRVEFENETIQDEAMKKGLVALRYVDNRGRKTKIYPANPSGSPLGITGLTAHNGRILIMMPQPEQALRSIQYPCKLDKWGEEAPWLRLFQNTRSWFN